MERYSAPYMVAILAILCHSGETTNCMDARNRCISRIGCSMALNNFLIACEPVRLGSVNYCTESCMRAVVSLVTVDDDIGTDILTCDCDTAADCLLVKKRISLCSDGVLQALNSLDTEETISCSLARMLCEADTSCWTALSFYEENCSNLWNRHNTDSLYCSSKCNNSVSILFRQRRAAKLRSCMCDNSDPVVDEDTCIKMRYNTETYCFGEPPQSPFYSTGKASQIKYENYSKDLVKNTAEISSGLGVSGNNILLVVGLSLSSAFIGNV